ncbi:MAG: hypothetical protein ACJ75B_20175 [Flavisolibacter sp.]
MRYHAIVLTVIFILFSCKKEQIPAAGPITVTGVKHILLKDISIPNLPSPYYHFEYNSDSLVTNVNFASGYTNYDVLYNGNKITEMRNNIFVNHDTLRYTYDNTGKLSMIKFINGANVIFRVVFFTYDGNLIKKIEWDQKDGNTGYRVDRTLSFTFYSDGNVQTITEHRPPIPGVDDYISVKTFEQYDDKINVDDFSLIHDGIHDHLFLPQGFRLQKNNPRKEKFSVNGSDYYSINYTYIYNSDHTPSDKAGDFIYLSGSSAGQIFRTDSFYSYY